MYSSGPNMPGDLLRWEDLQAIYTFLKTISEHISPNISINLIGGEPTLNMDHFGRVLDTVTDWKIQNRDYYTTLPEVETTTNGWWLENPETTLQFAKKVWRHLDKLHIRISNSNHHAPFRSPTLQKLCAATSRRNHEHTFYPLADFLEEMLFEMEDEYGQAFALQYLMEAAQTGKIHIESQTGDPDKISPVGRAKTNGIGCQDGACHPDPLQFTFMPTKEGERPGRIYDVCCNGGKIALGHANEGMKLVFRRILFLQALHNRYPRPEGYAINPLGGKRCWNCQSFGAAWLQNKHTEKTVISAMDTLRENAENLCET